MISMVDDDSLKWEGDGYASCWDSIITTLKLQLDFCWKLV